MLSRQLDVLVRYPDTDPLVVMKTDWLVSPRINDTPYWQVHQDLESTHFIIYQFLKYCTNIKYNFKVLVAHFTSVFTFSATFHFHSIILTFWDWGALKYDSWVQQVTAGKLL